MPAPLPDRCPPDDASPAEGVFLRFVSGDLEDGATPGPEDWILPHEQPKSPFYGQADRCECHAHSLLADPADVKKAQSLIPAFKKKRVATVNLTPDMGVVKNSPSARVGDSHHDWWPTPANLVPPAQVIP